MRVIRLLALLAVIACSTTAFAQRYIYSGDSHKLIRSTVTNSYAKYAYTLGSSQNSILTKFNSGAQDGNNFIVDPAAGIILSHADAKNKLSYQYNLQGIKTIYHNSSKVITYVHNSFGQVIR